LDFKGLKVNHKYESTRESFDFTVEDYQIMLVDQMKTKSNPAGRTSKVEEIESNITWEMISVIAEKNSTKYPDIWDMNEDDYAVLKADFPTLIDQQLEENIEIIDQYYENNLRFDIIIDLADTLNVNRETEAGRIIGNCIDDKSYFNGKATCTKEIWFGLWNAQAVKDIKEARDKAIQFEKDLYGDATGLTVGDAFRHSIWNTLIAKYYADRKKDVSKGVEMAKEFTDLHEECNKICGSNDWDIEMDKHNNFVGRNYFSSTAFINTTGKWPFKKKYLNSLTDDQYKNGTKAKADRAIKLPKSKSAVQSAYPYTLVYFQ